MSDYRLIPDEVPDSSEYMSGAELRAEGFEVPAVQVQKWGQKVLVSDKDLPFLVDPSPMAAYLRGIMDGSIKPSPPLPDPGPNPQWLALVAAAADNPVLADLVELHRPDAICYPSVIRWECGGDDFGGNESEPPEWPCSTVDIIARHLGVEVTS